MEVSQKSMNKIFNNKDSNLHSHMRKRKSLQSPKARFVQGKRPMTDFRSGMSPAKLIFVQDPLNLSSLCCGNVSLSPKNASPQDREINTVSPPKVNCKDPLHLNETLGQDPNKHPKKRKKRKRRNTSSFCEDEEKQGDTKPTQEKKVKQTITPPKSRDNNTQIPPYKTHKISGDKRRSIDQKSFKKKSDLFKYGNFDNYFGMNNQELTQHLNDRTRLFERQWFFQKKCLHIGCNSGFLTSWIARYLEPSHILGIDIDEKLIKMSRNNVDKFLEKNKLRKFPKAFTQLYGTIIKNVKNQNGDVFPNNVSFRQENYISETSASTQAVYDVILCLNICKWIQLNNGDAGLKNMFKKIFTQLKPGGSLLLEFHNHSSYRKHKNYTKETLKNFQEMRILPSDFISVLLSSEIGFSQSTCLGYNRWRKGGDRPLYLLKKSTYVEES